MTETAAEWSKEWVEMAWAARNAACAAMNAQRRAWFDGVRPLLLERDLPRSVIHDGAKVTRLAKAR
jgi:hypothetical protein